MTSRVALRIFVLVLLSLLAFPRSAKSEFIGVNWLGELYSIDEHTGQGTYADVLSAPASRSESMTMDASGAVYSTMFRQDPIAGTYLVTIAREGDGWAPSVGPRVFLNVRAIAFSPAGTLFAIRKNDVSGGDLYTIDVDTGVGTFVGSTILPGVVALDFSADGTLYGYAVGEGWDTGEGLVTIDTVTGLATDVDPTVGSSPFPVSTIAFAPDGTLYASFEDLFTVDLATGALTLVGPIGVDQFHGIGGMVWIPEPSTLSGLLSMALTALVVYLRRHRKRHAC